MPHKPSVALPFATSLPLPLPLFLFLFFLLLSFSSPSSATVLVLLNNQTFADRPAVFGPRVNSTVGEYGILVPMVSFNQSNFDACEDMDTYPTEPLWIALVQRGDCTFAEKVRLMQKAGATAVIVGDNVRGNLIPMGSDEDTRDIQIPSVFVSKDSYDELVLQASPANREYFLEVVINTNQIYFWPMLDIVIIAIIAPSLIMIMLYSIWRFRRRQQRQRELAPPSVVISLPMRIYEAPADPATENETCPICIEDYQAGDEIRTLPCKHEYHVGCIDQWLTTRKRFCPLCKMDACPGVGTEFTPLIIRTLGGGSSSAPSTSRSNNNPESAEETPLTATVTETTSSVNEDQSDTSSVHSQRSQEDQAQPPRSG